MFASVALILRLKLENYYTCNARLGLFAFPHSSAAVVDVEQLIIMRRKLPEDVLQELVEQVLVERLREQICRIISTRYSKYFNSILSYFISNMMKAYIYLFSLGCMTILFSPYFSTNIIFINSYACHFAIY